MTPEQPPRILNPRDKSAGDGLFKTPPSPRRDTPQQRAHYLAQRAGDASQQVVALEASIADLRRINEELHATIGAIRRGYTLAKRHMQTRVDKAETRSRELAVACKSLETEIAQLRQEMESARAAHQAEAERLRAELARTRETLRDRNALLVRMRDVEMM